MLHGTCDGHIGSHFLFYLQNMHRKVTQSTAILCNSLNYLKGMNIIITLALYIRTYWDILHVTEYHAGCDVPIYVLYFKYCDLRMRI